LEEPYNHRMQLTRPNGGLVADPRIIPRAKEAPIRIIDAGSKKRVRALQLYLTPQEAREFRKELDRLLNDPEANEHSHIDFGGKSELSFSIITERKLKHIETYSKIEREVLTEEE
jgi:ribosomal protein L20A (L18A)